MQRELDAANERFKEYERKDVKLREDIKHLSAKQKKLTDKLAKDTAKAEVRPIPGLPVPDVLPMTKQGTGTLPVLPVRGLRCSTAPQGLPAYNINIGMQREAMG